MLLLHVVKAMDTFETIYKIQTQTNNRVIILQKKKGPSDVVFRFLFKSKMLICMNQLNIPISSTKTEPTEH